MFTQRLFNHSAELMAGLVLHLIFSRWACGIEEHHGACEDAYAADIGLLHLEVNRCLVLDHDDAYVGVRIPTLHRSNGRWQWGRVIAYSIVNG